ncbi:MAG: hypothetical protein CMA60_05835 [Euryarchaeota archaeon]|nr:hypothetical protein [Euryarchaeota archaeon]|tara:strand:- start:1373 stop:1558 length:186 start_codon:yes stop_codon:yes gene_type:complete
MGVKIEFSTVNATFLAADGINVSDYMIATVLREIAMKIEGGKTEGAVVDNNGNTVGQWSIE